MTFSMQLPGTVLFFVVNDDRDAPNLVQLTDDFLITLLACPDTVSGEIETADRYSEDYAFIGRTGCRTQSPGGNPG